MQGKTSKSRREIELQVGAVASSLELFVNRPEVGRAALSGHIAGVRRPADVELLP